MDAYGCDLHIIRVYFTQPIRSLSAMGLAVKGQGFQGKLTGRCDHQKNQNKHPSSPHHADAKKPHQKGRRQKANHTQKKPNNP